ncbi:MAG: DUF2288 domain-containing protein [Thiogranum sp.]|nr:DUF2288 domain-containing protein [Thiogranum sp.]
MNKHEPCTKEQLNLETGRVRWQELEGHFARHVVIQVAGELDLVEVATALANDDKPAVEAWIERGQVQHLAVPVARDWAGRDPELWAVVVAPWVIVQERKR